MKTTFIIALVALAVAFAGDIGKANVQKQSYQHTVQAGETLWEIASKYTENTQDIREVIHEMTIQNKIKNAVIHQGDVLIVTVDKPIKE